MRKKKHKHKYKLHQWAEMLEANWKEGVSYGYTSPSPDFHRVPSWLWDSCFHAYMRARENPARAKTEMRTLLKFLYANGLPPQILYLENEGIGKRILERIFFKRYLQLEGPGIILTQPPIHAESVWEIYTRDGDIEFLKEVAPELKRIYRYFRDYRDPDNDGVISVIHPLETGMDSSPKFDEALYGKRGSIPFARFVINFQLYRRYARLGWDLQKIYKIFDFESVSFNTLYILNLEALAKILREIGDNDAREFESQAKKVTEALVRNHFDSESGMFYSTYSGDAKQAKIKTVAGLLPLALDIPKEIVAELVRHLEDPLEFTTNYPVPSVARNEPSFYPGSTAYLWRGTSWVNKNWYIVRGLIKHGYDELARDITKKTAEVVLAHGYREYYNPITGAGYGDTEHGWSTLLIDMLERTGLLEEYLEKSRLTAK